MVPVICPVSASQLNPAGRLSTSYLTGLIPVTGIVKRKGEPGRTPNIFAPFILGSGAGFGVSISASLTAFSCPVEQEILRNRKMRGMIIKNPGFIFIHTTLIFKGSMELACRFCSCMFLFLVKHVRFIVLSG
jgi:hypothetical protein